MRFLKLILVSVILAPTAALACGNEVQLSTQEQTQAVAKAEKLLESGEYAKAVKALIESAGMGPMNRRLEYVFTDPALRTRAQRVGAVAGVRSRGTVSLHHWNKKMKRGSGEAAAQLKWSVDMLEAEHKAKADDPQVASLYAEGLAETGKGEEALKILEDLAARDVMPDAFGWLALAKLRTEPALREAALEKCRLAAPKARLCALDPGAGGS